MGWRLPGALVWASSSTSTSCGRRASSASRSISSGSGPCSRRFLPRKDFQALSSASVSLRPCVSTTPTTTSTPSLPLGARRCQHLVGLADARRRAEEDLEPAARPSSRRAAASSASGDGRCRESRLGLDHQLTPACCSGLLAGIMGGGTVEREVERQNVDARLAQDTEQAALGMLDRRADGRDPRTVRAPWRRAEPGTAPLPAKYAGSSPLAEVVTRSSGTGGDRVLRLQCLDIALHALDQRLVGRPEVGAARVRGIVRRRTVLVGSAGSGAAVADGRPWK